ncbi:glycosyltransferase [Nocardioides mesophilus]|uniref:Glycosyltransferase n=2 Tax=Nocardioides mesophilus TaxID=433659 RepID=A0A7G9REF1_9ACTN|nr:glycosyltransferase [Nocardioides mesophilus]
MLPSQRRRGDLGAARPICAFHALPRIVCLPARGVRPCRLPAHQHAVRAGGGPKRTRLTIEAVAEVRMALPDLTLDVVGNGPELERLRALATQLGLDDVVTFYPGCSNEVRDQLAASAWLAVNARKAKAGASPSSSPTHWACPCSPTPVPVFETRSTLARTGG